MKKIAIAFLVVSLSLIFATHNAFAHHVFTEIPVGTSPMKMSITDDLLFVSNLGQREITIIDTKTDNVVGTIDASAGVVAVKGIPEKNTVYAATFESGGIDVYDLNTKQYLNTIELPDAKMTVWYSPQYEMQKYLTFVTGGAALDYNSNNEVLYVANYNANYIATIDTKTNQVLEKIPVSAHPYAIKVDPITNKILVANLAGNEITFLTPDESNPTKHVVSSTLKTGAGPWGIDIDADNHRAYITHRGDHHVTVVDTISEKVIDEIEVGDDTQAVSVDSKEHQIYVSYLQQNKIVKIDGKTDQIVNTIQSDALAWDLAVDSQTHKLFASMKGEDKVFVMGPKSISMSIPVTTMQSPVAYVGNVDLHGQDVYVSQAVVDTEKKALVLITSTEDGGKLDINIPRAILDAKTVNNEDSLYMVYADNKLIDQESVPSSDGGRAISIQVPKGTESITISGTSAIPEFGPLAGIILATSIVGIIILARNKTHFA